jgi:hypothetical protein
VEKIQKKKIEVYFYLLLIVITFFFTWFLLATKNNSFRAPLLSCSLYYHLSHLSCARRCIFYPLHGNCILLLPKVHGVSLLMSIGKNISCPPGCCNNSMLLLVPIHRSVTSPAHFFVPVWVQFKKCQ